MSRPGALVNANYVPTPPGITDLLIGYLARGQGKVVRMIDPCSGCGTALAALAEHLGARSYGIELSGERALQSAGRLDRVLNCSTFDVELTARSWSIMLLNPPYDYTGDQTGRMELQFLKETSRTLVPGGVLVFIIPQKQLRATARYLSSHYDNRMVRRFPDGEYEAFKQVVVLATKRDKSVMDKDAEEKLLALADKNLRPLSAAPGEEEIFRVPESPAKEPRFRSKEFNTELAQREAQRLGVWRQADLVAEIDPDDGQVVRPLCELNTGHAALFLAAGMLNNTIISTKDGPILLKGRSVKRLLERPEEGDEQTTVERETVVTTMVALYLATGTLKVLEA